MAEEKVTLEIERQIQDVCCSLSLSASQVSDSLLTHISLVSGHVTAVCYLLSLPRWVRIFTDPYAVMRKAGTQLNPPPTSVFFFSES